MPKTVFNDDLSRSLIEMKESRKYLDLFQGAKSNDEQRKVWTALTQEYNATNGTQFDVEQIKNKLKHLKAKWALWVKDTTYLFEAFDLVWLFKR